MEGDDRVNILLVDDRPENLLVLETMLERLEQTLIKAHSGEEALKQLLDQEFAVILLDVQMPGIDGFEIATLIKNRPKSQHVPIIFITAIDRTSAKAFKGYSVGAVDYLFKPIVPEILQAKVSTFIELHKKTKQAQRQSARIEAINADLKHQLEEVTRLNKKLAEMNAYLEHEILEREQVQEALQRSEKLYRTLARNVPKVTVALFDHDLRYIIAEGVLVHDQAIKQSVEGKTVGEVLPPEYREFWEPHYRSALAGQEIILEQKFDDRVYFCQVLPVRDEHDHIFAGMAVVQDITDFKRSEEALREMNEALEQKVKERTADLKASNDELTSFTYIVSHDLRSPLINLKGFSSELRTAVELICANWDGSLSSHDEEAVRQAVEKNIPEALSFIESAVARMDHLTNAVLTLSRLGRRELAMERIDTNSLTQEILNSMAHQIKQREATVIVEPLPEVIADRLSIEQILGNLLNNAVKYLVVGRPGKIRVWVERSSTDTVFHISDNGRGIEAEDRHKVFEPFRRVGKQTVPGEGMGLTYVQVLVRRHGGQIWFESQPNVGSTFSFSLACNPQGEAS